MENMSDVIEWVYKKAKAAPGPTKPAALHKLLKRIVEERFAQKEDFVDVLYYSGYGEARDFDFKLICGAFDLHLQSVFDSPGNFGTSVTGNRRLLAAEFAELLVRLRRLGLELDDKYLASALLPSLRQFTQVTRSELLILWYSKEKHDPEALGNDSLWHEPATEKFRTHSGRHVSLIRNKSGEAVLLVAGKTRGNCNTPHATKSAWRASNRTATG